MAEMNLKDVRGFWRDLAAPAYLEFWRTYQADEPLSRAHFSLIYRRLMSAALLINHQADKVATRDKASSGFDFISMVEKLDSDIGASLHACRLLVNDAKHNAKRPQSAAERLRRDGYDTKGDGGLLEINLTMPNEDVYDMCIVVGKAFNFWCDYFDGHTVINFNQPHVEPPSSK
ncbi:hypothetical protein FHW68_000668 [Pseudomonas sp. Tn43]|uniref:hypothetical protein n=1 Tax=Pseudomonas sp. Tn43 TaxID=701213 RepID=UPI00160F9DD7|nr:hypothetical protein [Pseudomonas sp. Tn43]MBB3239196.1 hypothetical protein [Pseudomonas sp. Tn43]